MREFTNSSAGFSLPLSQVDWVLETTFKGSLAIIRRFCCGATVGSEQQHNQDLREIYKGRRILEFITFDPNALHLTHFLPQCIAFNQSALRHEQVK